MTCLLIDLSLAKTHRYNFTGKFTVILTNLRNSPSVKGLVDGIQLGFREVGFEARVFLNASSDTKSLLLNDGPPAFRTGFRLITPFEVSALAPGAVC